MNLIPPTACRVPMNTSRAVNEKIRETTEANIAHYASHPEQIDRRLAELDREWDIERLLEANAATLAFVGTVLGAKVNKWWLLLPATVTAFLFQHAIQGWCPPLPLFRRLGVRTAQEIEAERYALKAVRGDFTGVAGEGRGSESAMKPVGFSPG